MSLKHLYDNCVGRCITRDTPVQRAIHSRQAAREILGSLIETEELQPMYEGHKLAWISNYYLLGVETS